MKTSIQHPIKAWLVLFAMLLLPLSLLAAGNNEYSVKDLHKRQLSPGTRVILTGEVARWEENLNQRHQADRYLLQDVFGDRLMVETAEGLPKIGDKLKVEGIISANNGYDSSLGMFDILIYESRREQVKNMTNVLLFGGLGLVFIALVVVIIVLLVRKPEPQPMMMAAGAMPAGPPPAVTMKNLPAFFEVEGGQPITLQQPQGARDYEISFMFSQENKKDGRTIFIDDKSVSRRQARLKVVPGENRYMLINIPDPKDPNRNATIINEKIMEQDEVHELQNGDKIQMGLTTLVFKKLGA